MIKYIVQLIDALVWPLVLLVIIWLAFFLNHGYHLDWNDFGMRPQELKGIFGIFTMPFLHGSFDHLFSNSIPLLLSMGFIFLYFKESKWHIILIGYVLTGALLWFMGDQPSNHIGASGLVYAFIAFLITHAAINKNKETTAAAFILVFLYGSLIYGIFPDYGRLIGKNISWEGHLSGLIAGVILGFFYRNQGPQKRLFFEDEDEDEDENDDPTDYTIHYHYFPSEEQDAQ